MKQEQRKALLAGALAALCLSAASVSLAAVATPVVPMASGAAQATFDALLDQLVTDRVASKRITAAQALVAREQLLLQFRALPAEVQATVLSKLGTGTDSETAARLEQLLLTETQRTARRMMVGAPESRGAGTDAAESVTAGKPMARLGLDGDYVFVPTVGPCRVADSRFAAAGPLGSTAARQLYAYSQSGGYDWTNQGGTGTAGIGNCVGTEFIGTEPPVAVIATVAVTNGGTAGSMRAWNGGTNLTVGGILGWSAGQTISNTTVIPVDRSITAYPGSGTKRDFGLYNNSGGNVDYIIDVVGYFAVNKATPLDCYVEVGPSYDLNNGISTLYIAPTCDAGYTAVVARPIAAYLGLYIGTLNEGQCRISNASGVTRSVACDTRCCRVPGR